MFYNVQSEYRAGIIAVHDPYFTNDPIFRSCALKQARTRILGFADILEFVCGKMFPQMLDVINNIFVCLTTLIRMNNIGSPPYLIL